jgi:hypothetical protein
MNEYTLKINSDPEAVEVRVGVKVKNRRCKEITWKHEMNF